MARRKTKSDFERSRIGRLKKKYSIKLKGKKSTADYAELKKFKVGKKHLIKL